VNSFAVSDMMKIYTSSSPACYGNSIRSEPIMPINLLVSSDCEGYSYKGKLLFKGHERVSCLQVH
jgi:hypothetical protein